MSQPPNLDQLRVTELLKPEDSALMAALHAREFRKGWSAEFFEDILTSSTGLGIGIFDVNLELLGFCLSRWVVDEAEILTIVVDKKVRQRGIGFLLLSKTLAQLRKSEVNQVFLEVFEQNQAALALYRKLGFETIGIRENYYLDTEEQVGNAIVLKLFLNK